MLRRVSDFNQAIGASTRGCALFGYPVKQSASPAMQNAALAALGLNWRYFAFEVAPADLRAAILGAQAMKFIGLNLTVPHKVSALEMVDVLDDSAKTWGAINTIGFEARAENNQWLPLAQMAPHQIKETRSHGYNTDADALASSLTEDLGVKLSGARVLLLGAGGAGKAAALKLAAEGVADLFVVNRTATKALEIVGNIRQRYPRVNAAAGYPEGMVDLVINATSLGLQAEDPLPLDRQRFPLQNARAVYDMIYHPALTALLLGAGAAGCRTANGLGMLLRQGAKALELWSGRPAPLEVMRRALEKSIYG